MRNLKQLLITKTFVAVMAALFVAGLGLAGLAREGGLTSAAAKTNSTVEKPASGQPEAGQEALPNRAATRAVDFPRTRYCSLGSLQGNYADAASASLIPGGFSPSVCVGIVTFDGRGNLVSKESHSFNGQIIPEANYTGTYTVNSNCTGTMTLKSVELGITVSQNFAITEDNKEVPYVVTDDGVVSSGVMKKM